MCDIAVLLFALLCPDVVQVGVEAHAQAYDAPEISGLPNPLFVGNLQWKLIEDGRNSLRLVLEHTSSIPREEAGYGLNTIGIRATWGE